MTTVPMTPTSSQPTDPLVDALVDPLGGDLVGLLRTLKLSGMKDTLPQRLTLAKTRQLSHYQFLEQVLADEVARREDRSATARACARAWHPGCGSRPGPNPPTCTTTASCSRT